MLGFEYLGDRSLDIGFDRCILSFKIEQWNRHISLPISFVCRIWCRPPTTQAVVLPLLDPGNARFLGPLPDSGSRFPGTALLRFRRANQDGDHAGSSNRLGAPDSPAPRRNPERS